MCVSIAVAIEEEGVDLFLFGSPEENCLFARDFRSKIEIERQILMYEEKPQSQKAL